MKEQPVEEFVPESLSPRVLRATAPQPTTRTGYDLLALVFFVAGLGLLVWFWFFYGTSVAAPDGPVYNFSRASSRLAGIVTGSAFVLLGGLLQIVDRLELIRRDRKG